MRFVRLVGLVIVGAVLAPAGARAEPTRATAIVVVGAEGTKAYGATFAAAAQAFADAARRGGATVVEVGRGARATSDKQQLREALAAARGPSTAPLWLVLIGHGTFDGRDSRFALRGADLTARELVGELASVRRPIVVIDTSSASGPVVKALAAPGRVVVAATRSGQEAGATRLALPLARALTSPAADLDQDGQVSLLEAFLHASREVESGFASEGLLATEHAIVDDNGDGLGTPASFFEGLRPARKAAGETALDGTAAHKLVLVPGEGDRAIEPGLRRRRDELEEQVRQLRAARTNLGDDVYYRRLEPLLLELARIGTGATSAR